MKKWEKVKKILCIRADNMGDVLMCSPALKALKDHFQAEITLLTSSMGALITPFVSSVDKTIICDLPWVGAGTYADAEALHELAGTVKLADFDAAVIFTVYSQPSLPAAMLCYLAGIPLRLAYARENPYALLTDWVPDKEPYDLIRHQVERDLALIQSVGVAVRSDEMDLSVNDKLIGQVLNKLGIEDSSEYIVLHPGVSELKRQYPVENWQGVLKMLMERDKRIFVLTGSSTERALCESIIADAPADRVFNAAGLLSIEEFIAVIDGGELLISVNTSAVHIASARKTSVIVLYALTNPQHTPWKTHSKVLAFSVPEHLKSKNEIVRFVDKKFYRTEQPFPDPSAVVCLARAMEPHLYT